MSEEPTVTMEELARKRRAAGARLLHLCLLPGQIDQHGVDSLAINLQAALTEAERAEMLRVILHTFPPDLAEAYVKAFFTAAGWPTTGIMDDARADASWWAESATPAEHRAYAQACLQRMSKKDRTAVRKWLEDKG